MDPETNPYTPPDAHDSTRMRPGRLSAHQRRVLAELTHYHACPPTVGRYIRRNWKASFLSPFILIMMALGLYAAGQFVLAVLLLGYCLGVVSYTHLVGWDFVSRWPLLDRIFDWGRVRRLMEGPDDMNEDDETGAAGPSTDVVTRS